jgi:hypothetical protein
MKLVALSIIIAMLMLVSVVFAHAGTSCTTRQSGSVTITSCSSGNSYSQCRSYRSGRVVKTNCS